MKPFLPRLVLALGTAWAVQGDPQGLPRAGPIKPAPDWQQPDTFTESKDVPVTPQRATRSTSALPEQDGFYDPNNPAFHQLQKANQALGGMPVDRAGFVDWMRLLDDGRIVPQAGISGNRPLVTLELDVLLKNTRQMPWVRFPHRSHTLWLDCSNCHPVPFAQKTGAARISMETIFRGQWCGMCHDRVAFITHLSCERCHSVPNPAASVPE